MAKTKPTSQSHNDQQILKIIESFKEAQTNALQKLASREDNEFKPGSLNWWSGKVGSIMQNASEIRDRFQRGQVALKTFDDDAAIQAIGNNIKVSARKNLEEIIRISVTMYYQFCIDLDDVKERGKR
ncbi:hypothetical protein [Leptospira santarosai]|uniref:hypothetical protein n=1 Tax=Leptospira santarosai TaxID=28183 RepID=UPI0024AF67BE|nr:hypothetical protein [Leptospira santarosai]MDI7189088.1 hypothetical protein [Leptospira santarosai]MDI7221223.1 hypothetical protein [Leptospira santarosai]